MSAYQNNQGIERGILGGTKGGILSPHHISGPIRDLILMPFEDKNPLRERSKNSGGQLKMRNRVPMGVHNPAREY